MMSTMTLMEDVRGRIAKSIDAGGCVGAIRRRVREPNRISIVPSAPCFLARLKHIIHTKTGDAGFAAIIVCVLIPSSVRVITHASGIGTLENLTCRVTITGDVSTAAIRSCILVPSAAVLIIATAEILALIELPGRVTKSGDAARAAIGRSVIAPSAVRVVLYALGIRAAQGVVGTGITIPRGSSNRATRLGIADPIVTLIASEALVKDPGRVAKSSNA